MTPNIKLGARSRGRTVCCGARIISACAAGIAQQVAHFLEIVNPTKTDWLVLDFEPNPVGESGAMTLAEAEAEEFVTTVNGEIGRHPRLYSGQSFIRETLGNKADTPLKNCFLWIAKYSSGLPTAPPAWNAFAFWQYTDGNSGDQPHQVPSSEAFQFADLVFNQMTFFVKMLVNRAPQLCGLPLMESRPKSFTLRFSR